MPLLIPPDNGVTVRMYRQGHGDCFLIAFPSEAGDRPYYVMIDCGYKPGSENFLSHGKSIGDVVEHLRQACGGELDLVILTHEHQDHLNGIWKSSKPYFDGFVIKETWLAWTEDPNNKLANDLRRRHRDQLLGLVEARRELALAVGDENSAVKRLDALLSLELGLDSQKPTTAQMRAAAGDPKRSVNKQAMKFIKEQADKHRGRRYCYPGKEPVPLEGTKGIRAYIFGPPENDKLIADEDPRDNESFPRGNGLSFTAAVSNPLEERKSPFTRHHFVPIKKALASNKFFIGHYGKKPEGEPEDRSEAGPTAEWRRIDGEWLYSAETLALKLNQGINNTSLAIAFELPTTKKVLFFAADAQRGNWFSWKDLKFQDGGDIVTAKDVLGRTVLYKAGHHGSHNATLSGTKADQYANLSWMGLGESAKEFTAMITAVNEWAVTQNTPPWEHPLPSIKKALLEKARGRVLQTDEGEPPKPAGVSAGEWKQFIKRLTTDELYFDLEVLDD